MDYILQIVTLTSALSLGAVALYLPVRIAGLPLFCQGWLIALGAYSSAVASLHFGFGPWTSGMVALAAGAIGSTALLGIARLGTSTFAVATLALQLVGTGVIRASERLGGASGLVGVAAPRFGGWSTGWTLAVTGAACLCTVIAIAWLLAESRTGLSARVWSVDRLLLDVTGRPWHLPIGALLMTNGLFAGAAGWLYSVALRYIDPGVLSMNESVATFVGVALGASRGPAGVAGATALLVLLPEALRMFGIDVGYAAEVRQLLFGLLLAALALGISLGRGLDGRQARD